VRHVAVQVDGDTLSVVYSRIGDEPERLLASTIDRSVDWTEWEPSEPRTVLAPEHDYEGVEKPIRESAPGLAPERVHELRDPDLFEDSDGRTYLFYAIAGEHGIAAAAGETPL